MSKKHHHHHRHQKFEVVDKDCGHGARSKVSLVKRKSDGKLIIWKRARHHSLQNQESFRKELKKVKQWRKFGISKVKACWHSDKFSLLKTYVEGPSLKKVLKRHPNFFSEKKGKYYKALIRFVEKLVDSHHYIHDLKGSNIFFDGKNWNVVDTGPIHKRPDRSSTRKIYRKLLFKKWSGLIHSEKEIDHFKSFLEEYCR